MARPTTSARTGSIEWPTQAPGYVPAYQVSADPYFRMLRVTSSAATVINLPFVTKFFQITNYSSGTALRIGVTENGVNDLPAGTNAYFVLSGAIAIGGDPQPQTLGPLEIRTARLTFLADPPVGQVGALANIHVGILAGLATIAAKDMWFHTGSGGWKGVG